MASGGMDSVGKRREGRNDVMMGRMVESRKAERKEGREQTENRGMEIGHSTKGITGRGTSTKGNTKRGII